MAAIQFDTRLGELGGQRMLKRGVGDDRDEVRPSDVVKIIKKKTLRDTRCTINCQIKST